MESKLDILQLERDLFSNKCSTYIDTNKHYKIVANDLIEKSKNMKKLRQRISSKFRKIIRLNKSTLAKENKDKNNLQLVNFKLINTSLRQNAFNMNSRRASICTQHSTSSGGSNEYDENEFESHRITHLFSRREIANNQTRVVASASQYIDCQSNSDFLSTLIQTSTPNCSRVRPKINFNPASFVHDSENLDETVDNNDMVQFLDESTQIPVDEPVLLESTFDSSSCSNLSDDLIILQTAIPQKPTNKPMSSKKKSANKSVNKSSNKTNWNLFVINKYNEDSEIAFEQIPKWAVGTELNLALVNQLYYNPNANGVFVNSNKI
jgi:hypothetical protein